MQLMKQGVILENGKPVPVEDASLCKNREKTLTYQILQAHHQASDDDLFHITFDSLTSHDITYVGIIQTARASGMEKFPVPYVLTNCHNTLCAVGGTINEDDHAFALSCAHKYGGIYVPPNLAVIHSYNRERMTGCGRMILGSDSHTRYGALGTMGIGEGGGELSKQLIQQTYDIAKPEVVLIYLTGKPRPGVGPHDVALALIAATYANGFVKNRVMEFAGPGIANLSQDYRNGIDVMTTETTCLSSIWETDETTEAYYRAHGRQEAYQKLTCVDGAYYDACITLDLSTVACMIALPMHPSLALPIRELKANPQKYLQEAQERIQAQSNREYKESLLAKVDENNQIHMDQGIIAGCSGGIYENIVIAAQLLKDQNPGNGSFKLSVYPDSMPMAKALVDNGAVSDLLGSGVVFREAFCGPCFGAGDTPANGELSIRHTTRNFPNREGSKPTEGQISYVCLMDARSIAATARNHGILTAADEIMQEDIPVAVPVFDQRIYEKRVYDGFGKAEPDYPLHFGPNIKDWPSIPSLSKDLLLKIVSHIDDDVTTTDELIPSGETSSYRSNPLRLAEFTLSRRDPSYVAKAKEVQNLTMDSLTDVLAVLRENGCEVQEGTLIESAIYARKPGDGSAREQAASCQRVLGAGANFAKEYATKRYRSNCINWGMIPFLVEEDAILQKDTWVYIKNVKESLEKDLAYEAYAIVSDHVKAITLTTGDLSQMEREILSKGCLINYNRMR